MSGSLAGALDLTRSRHLGKKDGSGERADSFDGAEQLMIAGELVVRADLLPDIGTTWSRSRLVWNLFWVVGFNLLLHMMRHRQCDDQNQRCDHLVRVKRRVEDSPCDAHRRECLHHLEVTGSGCAPEMQP